MTKQARLIQSSKPCPFPADRHIDYDREEAQATPETIARLKRIFDSYKKGGK